MRDIIVTLFILGSLPFILRKPFFGVLMWALMSLMNPHMLCWGFALSIPFAQIIALTLFASLLMSQETKTLPNNSLVIILGMFWFWMFLSTLGAFNPKGAWYQWGLVWKMMLLTFITIMLLTNKIRIISLTVCLIISLGFYGVKGGLFTLATGGTGYVLGPRGTMIGENNALGLALIMTVPLMRFLQLQMTNRNFKNGMGIAIALMLVSIAGSQSRGAFLGIIAMIAFLLIKSSRKGLLFLGLALLLPAIVLFMPDAWMDRMESIRHFEKDGSAMSRINSWITIWRIALDYPLLGGGFQVFASWAWNIYSPNPNIHFDAHSIYFEVMGEHGFIGFFLFFSIGVLSFWKSGKIADFAKQDERLSWMKDLSAMIQVSIVGYAVTGTFLGVAYYDYFYFLVALVVGLETLQKTYQREGIPESEGAGLFQAVDNPDSIAASPPRRDRTQRGRRRTTTEKQNAIKSWYQSL